MLAGIRDVDAAPPARHDDRPVRGVAGRSASRSGRRWPASSSTASAGRSRRSSALSALLSVGTAAARHLRLAARSGRRSCRPAGSSTSRSAALRGVLTDRAVRRIFAIFGISFVAIQMSRPYIPVLVEQHRRDRRPGWRRRSRWCRDGRARRRARRRRSAGSIGDRIGFRPVLVAALAGGGRRPAADAVRRRRWRRWRSGGRPRRRRPRRSAR